jgi:phenylpyruvate tautomerase PptA (4-oxalocrotonate tautomerase family)
MPITVTIIKGVFTSENEKQLVPELSKLMMELHGLTGNRFMTPVVIGSLNVVSPDHIFSGGEPAPAVFIEWKVPSFGFATQEIRNEYVKRGAEAVVKLSNGKLATKNVFVNVLHAVDGSWGVNGKAYTNEELGAAIQANLPY